MIVRLHTILYLLFVMFILTLPVNSLFETIAYFQGTLSNDKTDPLTPFYFKVFKDIFLIGGLFLIVFMGGLRYVKVSLIPIYFFLAFTLLFAFFSINEENSFSVLLGVRSYFMVFFIVLGYYFYDFDTLKIYPWLRFILYVELVVQVLQVFYAPPFYGKQFHGLSVFNPGTFLIPSTMASFAILVHHYARKQEDTLTIILSLVSIFLAKSSTAWIVTILYYVIVIARKKRLGYDVVIAGLAITALLIFLNLDQLTGRPGIFNNNILVRWDIFVSSLSFPFGKGFGLGTGAVVLSNVDNAVIADSTLASLLLNFGWAGMLIYMCFIVGAVRVFHFQNFLLIAFIGFSFTMIVFEMTPFIQFFFFEFGRAIQPKPLHQPLVLEQ